MVIELNSVEGWLKGRRRVTDAGFTIRTSRWSAIAWLPVGIGLLYLAIDLRFVHSIPGATAEASESWIVFLILLAIGLSVVYPAMRAILRPRTLLAVDTTGVTISGAGDRSDWNSETNQMDLVIGYGEEQHIPWSLVERVEAGHIERVIERQVGGTVVSQTAASKTRIGGRTERSTRRRPALRILCDRSVSMELVSVRNLIQARTGDEPGDITSADRKYYSEEELADLTSSEFLIDSRLLPDQVANVVNLMHRLQSQAG
jgi:hypothetical protein